MKKYEILYDWPITELTRLADSDVADIFSASLVEPELSAFVKLAEQMRGLGADMARAKADRQHFGKWGELRTHLQQFEQQFATFPDTVPKKFRMSVLLADKITQAAPPLDNDNIDENLFEIRQLSTSLPIPWFSRENALSFVDSVAVFSSVDFLSLERAVSGANLSPKFLFHFLAALNGLPVSPQGHAVLVKKASPQPELAAIEAFAKLAILASGAPIHSTHPYTAPPCVIDPDCIRSGASYHQWNDVLHVISEYNSRDELLLKYLTIYHVIENFMFKRPIVELESKQAGKVFTIRDFRRLYRQVETKESDAIKQLFSAVAKMPATAVLNFEKQWVNRWASVFPAAQAPNVDSALGALDMGFKHGDFTVGQAAARFAQLVYAIRNAVVHNKETEFHLTYASLDATFLLLIESFLIPSLEEICFALVGQKNTQLWYSQDKLYFYK